MRLLICVIVIEVVCFKCGYKNTYNCGISSIFTHDLQYLYFMATSKEMTSGRPFPLIFNFVTAVIIGKFASADLFIGGCCDCRTVFGINDLAAVGASTSVVFLILGFCNGCCGGFGIPVAQKFGARDYGTMRRLVSVSLQLAVVMSVVIAIVTQSLLCRYSEGDAYP